jgi:4-aminobutyrate aminotransferase/(S)-3-amino-2-methylpropionate transaminase
VGCAVALRVIEIVERERWVERTQERGERWITDLRTALASAPRVMDVRGRGLLIGIEVDVGGEAARVVREALQSGWILLAEGSDGRVLTLCPPLNIPETLLSGATERLVELLGP